MKTRLFLVMVLALLLIVSTAFAQKPDFSGTWVFNAEKSKLPDMGGRGGRGMGGGGEMTITHKDNALEIVTVRVTQRGERKNEMKMELGGKAVTTSTQRGDNTYKGYWAENGKDIIVETEMVSERFSMTSKSTYILSADGKLLTVKTVRSTPRGDMETELVYDKKEKK